MLPARVLCHVDGASPEANVPYTQTCSAGVLDGNQNPMIGCSAVLVLLPGLIERQKLASAVPKRCQPQCVTVWEFVHVSSSQVPTTLTESLSVVRCISTQHPIPATASSRSGLLREQLLSGTGELHRP